MASTNASAVIPQFYEREFTGFTFKFFFLKDKDQSMEILSKIFSSNIHLLCIRYNVEYSSIPTSTTVDRLFSIAAIILTLRRNKLDDCITKKNRGPRPCVCKGANRLLSPP